MNKEIQIDTVTGKLSNFIIEPYLDHKDNEEFYICIHATKYGNRVLYHKDGGVQVGGDIDTKAHCVDVSINSALSINQALSLVDSAPPQTKQ